MTKNNRAIHNETLRRYTLIWSKSDNITPPDKYHFNSMQEVILENIVDGKIGLDVGCGLGWDTFIMARRNPLTRVIGMDINKSVYATSRFTLKPKNVTILRGTATRIPLKDNLCDFVYSFGVLHHIPNYRKAFMEVHRVLKVNRPAFLYLYESHADNTAKRLSVKATAVIRKFTVRIPPKVMYIMSLAASPVVVVLFTYPAKIFKRFKKTYWIYEAMPFNFGSSPFSLAGDIYDRFATPVEIRFGKDDLANFLKECSFANIKITRLNATAGWVVTAYKT